MIFFFHIEIITSKIIYTVFASSCKLCYEKYKMSLCVRKPTIWVPSRSGTNRPVQSQKQARSLKFWIIVKEELYYPCSKNKGAAQLRSYCEADLRLYFRICRLLVFLCDGSYKRGRQYY